MDTIYQNKLFFLDIIYKKTIKTSPKIDVLEKVFLFLC